MKIAVIGSRGLSVENLELYIPKKLMKLCQVEQRALIPLQENTPRKRELN